MPVRGRGWWHARKSSQTHPRKTEDAYYGHPQRDRVENLLLDEGFVSLGVPKPVIGEVKM